MSSFRTINSVLFTNRSTICLNRGILDLSKHFVLARSSSTSYKLKLITNQVRTKSDNKKNELSPLTRPAANADTEQNDRHSNPGQDMVDTKLGTSDVNKVINSFYQRKTVRTLCLQNGMDDNLLRKGFISFRKHCLELSRISPELYVVFSDIIQNKTHVDELYTFFMKHCKEIFPHLNCLEELKKISDLRLPIHWYPEARKLNRRIIYHSGPTNSGKTYNALQSFMNAESGIYCGPLKLLAVEVYNKTNENGVKCDLVTGEEKISLSDSTDPSKHVSCTVEMINTQEKYDVAVIDEIQMIRDPHRGYAWTRALLGLQAKEIHICGEAAAIDIIKEVLNMIDEKVEVKKYKRLSPLQISSQALQTLDNVQDGDCIVCFNKASLFNICLELEKLNKRFAVIYGSLPPSTKLLQSKKFNDPNDPCKILVATDAIGMGMNLSIKRIIFSSLTKTVTTNEGKEMERINTSMALQIAGRAGRFKSGSDLGYATTLKTEELPILKKILKEEVPPINSLGLFPNAEQLELFAYHLPKSTLKELIDIFVSVCQMNESNYFMCDLEGFKLLAELIQHIELTMNHRYILCTAPVDLKNSFICTMFLKFARAIAQNEPMTLDEVSKYLQMPFKAPKKIQDLIYLESAFDVFDLYLWLGFRFQLIFPDIDPVKQVQKQLDTLINTGITNLAQLVLKDKAPKIDLSGKLKRTTERLQNLENLQDIYETHNSGFDGELTNGELTEKLLSSGLLTKTMIKQLQQEWINSFKNEIDSKKRK